METNLILYIRVHCEERCLSLPFLDLCKTVTLGLNQTLIKEDIVLVSQKYDFNLKEGRRLLKNTLKIISKKIKTTKKEISNLEDEFNLKHNLSWEDVEIGFNNNNYFHKNIKRGPS